MEAFDLVLAYETRERRFRDNRGRDYSKEQAQHLWASGACDGCNLALRRLIDFDWDEDKLAEWFVACDKARGKSGTTLRGKP